jgi:hypothetical protein
MPPFLVHQSLGSFRKGSLEFHHPLSPVLHVRFCSSINWVCKIQKTAVENLGVSFRQSTFDWISWGFLEKRPRHRLIPPRLSAADSLNKDGKIWSSTFRLSTFLRIFQQKRPMKNDAPANQVLQRETDCYYIIEQTYDVGLHSRRHPMDFDAGTRPFASFDAPSSWSRRRRERRVCVCVCVFTCVIFNIEYIVYICI